MVPVSSTILAKIYELEQRGLVTRTFRRLDPDRQMAVLNAILTEAAAQGPSEINIRRVAERAGVAVGSLYQYFGSRARLLDFATELVVESVIGDFKTYRPMLAALPLREALKAYLLGGLEWTQVQAGAMHFFARAAYQGDPGLQQSVVRPVADEMRGVVEEILNQAHARGEIRSDVDLPAAARVLHALTIAISDPLLLPFLNVYFQIVDDDLTFERVLEAMVDLVVNGVGARDDLPGDLLPPDQT